MIGSRQNLRLWLMCFALVLGTMVIYWPVHNFDFIEFDDPDYVFSNETVRKGLTWWGLTWAFVDAHACNWHPVTWLSHMVDCQLYGLNAGAHHVTNLLLHAGNGALLFLLLRSMTGAFWRSALVAAAFAWHPLRVESVAWVSERKDVLSGFFFLLTLWMYARYAASNDSLGRQQVGATYRVFGPLRKSIWYKMSLSFFVLGLLSKPMLVTVPCLLLVLDFWPLRRFAILKSTNGARVASQLLPARVGELFFEKIPFFLLSGAVAFITFLAQKGSGAVIPLSAEGIPMRVATALTGYVQYLEKIAWPVDLTFLYLRPERIPVSEVVLSLLILATITGLTLATFRRWPFLCVGWLWFVGMLLPVSGLVQTGMQSIADRYTYLPAIGLVLAASWSFGEIIRAATKPSRAPDPDGGNGPTPNARERGLLLCSILICSGILLSWGLVTRLQIALWRNTEVLMEHALRIDPNNYIAHRNLAIYFSNSGRIEEAKVHRARMVELAPAFSNSRQSAGKTNATPNSPSGSLDF